MTTEELQQQSEGCLYYTWDELIDEGKAGDLMVRKYPIYAAIYKDTFGKYPVSPEQYLDEEKAERYIRMRHKKRIEELMKMSYEELQKKDLLKELKKLTPAGFEIKYNEYKLS